MGSIDSFTADSQLGGPSRFSAPPGSPVGVMAKGVPSWTCTLAVAVLESIRLGHSKPHLDDIMTLLLLLAVPTAAFAGCPETAVSTEHGNPYSLRDLVL